MSAMARQNGWRGFDGLAEKIEGGGWSYYCDGMPGPMGCGSHIEVSRRWATVGKKKGGWVICYGQDGPDGVPDEDVVLTFCPSCVVLGRVTTP